MARVFITGSADGLGQLSARLLVEQGHQVVLHARNADRAQEASKKTPGAEAVLVADLADIDQTKRLGKELNQLGTFDAVIHNAGVYQTSAKQIVCVNTLAPYILTSLIRRPKRLIYLTSGMHLSGRPTIDDLKHNMARVTYSDSKLHVMLLALAVARKWPDVYSNAVDPGWVPTKMGGRGAPDDLQKGYATQVWLAVSNDDNARVTGRYFYHQKARRYNASASDASLQDRFLQLCRDLTGVSFPA